MTDSPTTFDECLREVDEKSLDETSDQRVKEADGFAWLSVISKNVYTWKCLMSHDQTQSKESLQRKDPANYVH